MVHQGPPNNVVKAPSRAVPVVGKAAKICFGPVGKGFDLSRLV
jgi:hypothetical protein